LFIENIKVLRPRDASNKFILNYISEEDYAINEVVKSFKDILYSLPITGGSDSHWENILRVTLEKLKRKYPGLRHLSTSVDFLSNPEDALSIYVHPTIKVTLE
jgi:hypothetical protein